MAVDRLCNRIFIADAKGGVVQQFDLSDKLLSRSPASLGLNFPNRLRYLGEDNLLVADNDNCRLVLLFSPTVGDLKKSASWRLAAMTRPRQGEAGSKTWQLALMERCGCWWVSKGKKAVMCWYLTLCESG